MPASVVKIWELVNNRSRCVHCPQVVTDYFSDMLTEGPSVQTQQTQVTSCKPCSTTRVCKGPIIEYLLLAYTSDPRLVAKRVDPNQTSYPAAPDLGPHRPPRPFCPNRTDPCHAMHSLQHNQDLHCSEYRIKHITTYKHFTSQMSS